MALVGEVIKILGRTELSNQPPQPVILEVASQKISFPSRPLPEEREIEKIWKS
jgi:hypothetical protein